MKYFVRADFVDPGPLLPPQQLAAVVENAVLPSLDTLGKWDAERRISGGLVTGARAFAFVIDASTNDELDKILQGLPVWGLVSWQVTPLTSFADRIPRDRQSAQQLKTMK
jgi:hypothetical protein